MISLNRCDPEDSSTWSVISATSPLSRSQSFQRSRPEDPAERLTGLIRAGVPRVEPVAAFVVPRCASLSEREVITVASISDRHATGPNSAS